MANRNSNFYFFAYTRHTQHNIMQSNNTLTIKYIYIYILYEKFTNPSTAQWTECAPVVYIIIWSPNLIIATLGKGKNNRFFFSVFP